MSKCAVKRCRQHADGPTISAEALRSHGYICRSDREVCWRCWDVNSEALSDLATALGLELKSSAS